MGILSFLGMRGKALTGTPGVLEVARAHQLTPYLSLGSSPNARRADRINAVYVAQQNASYGWIYEYSPTVRTVIDYIARNVAQLGLKVYKRVSDDEREHVGDHPAAQSLRSPNTWTPGQQFIFDLVVEFLIYDNAYALKFRGPGNRRTLVNIPSHLVGIVGQSYYQPQAYRIWDQDGGSFDVAAESMIHWRGKDTTDPRRGKSKLDTLREELAADAASRQATTELYRSGLALPGWLERPLEAPEISAEGLKRLQEDVANQMQGAKRRPPIFEEGMSYKQGGVTPEDAELLAARRWTAEQVSGLYGMCHVPPEGEDERRQFYADVLPPITEMLAAFLDLQVLVAEYGADDHYFQFNLDEKLMSDDRIKTLVSAAGGPVFTRDEARAHLDLPKVPGGDELITPLNVSVGGKPSPQVMPPQNPNGPPQDGSHRSGEADRPVAAGSRASLNGNGHHKALLVPHLNAKDQRRNRWGREEYTPQFAGFFTRQLQTVKSRKVKAVTDERWNRELADDILEISRRHFSAEGVHAAFRMASEFDPDQGQNWLTAKALGSAEAINATTQQHIEEMGLEDAFKHAVEVRAPAAGMVYATDIAGFATKAAIQQTPDADRREVVIAGGECEMCADMQGTYLMDEVPQWPGYHPSCGCVADVKSIEPAKPDPRESEVATKALEILAAAFTSVSNGGMEGYKAIAKAIAEQKPAEVNVDVKPAETHYHEGAMKFDAAIQTPSSDVNFEKGAIQIDNTVEAPPPAEVNVQAAPAPNVNVESPVTNVTLPEQPIHIDNPVTVEPANVNVEAAPAPNVKVDVDGRAKNRTVKFSDGSTAEITGDKVTFSDGSQAEIEEKDQDD